MSFSLSFSLLSSSSVVCCFGRRREEETQRLSISTRRIEMRAEHCCWCCCSIVRYFFPYFFEFLDSLSPILSLDAFCRFSFSFCLHRVFHASKSTDSGKNNAHTICNSFEGKWEISATEKHIRFWRRDNQIRIEKRIYFPTQGITKYTQSSNSDKVQNKKRKRRARNSMSRFLHSLENKQRTQSDFFRRFCAKNGFSVHASTIERTSKK